LTVSQGKVAALNRCGGKLKIPLLMAYSLSNKCAENLSKRAVLVQLIIENMVTFFGTQCTGCGKI